jgi:hypothetical protein
MSKEQRQLSAGLVVGNRYQVERYLGASSMGSAYFCTDLRGGGTSVVLRILSLGASISEQVKASSREFSLLRRLNHPNLVRIADFGVVENSGDLFLVRDWIQGRNLSIESASIPAHAGHSPRPSESFQRHPFKRRGRKRKAQISGFWFEPQDWGWATGPEHRNIGLYGSGDSVGRTGKQELRLVLAWNFDVSAVDTSASV